MVSTLSIWVFVNIWGVFSPESSPQGNGNLDCSVDFYRGPWMMIFSAMVIHIYPPEGLLSKNEHLPILYLAFSYSSPQKQLWRTRSKCRPDQFWIHILTLSAIWRENSLYMLKLFIVTSLEEGLKGLSLILNSKITLPLAGASIKGGQGGNYQPRFCQNWWRL